MNHTLAKTVNEAYFGSCFDTEYGFKLYSPHSKYKNKHIVSEESDIEKYALDGEILCAKPFSTDNITLTETAYCLPNIFKSELYSTRKNYKKRVLYPLRSKFDIELLTDKDLDNAVKMHDIWVEKKLENPKTFKMLFSTTRYKKCLKYINDSRFLCLKLSQDGEMKGWRILSKEQDWLMDIANICTFWERSQMSESININMYEYLASKGFLNMNLGLSQGLNRLKFFKESYPHSIVNTYRKLVKQKTLFDF